jgi:hypothetical protein
LPVDAATIPFAATALDALVLSLLKRWRAGSAKNAPEMAQSDQLAAPTGSPLPALSRQIWYDQPDGWLYRNIYSDDFVKRDGLWNCVITSMSF